MLRDIVADVDDIIVIGEDDTEAVKTRESVLIRNVNHPFLLDIGEPET